MEIRLKFLVCCFLVIVLSGCQAVNQAVQGPSYVAGSVLAVPQSVTQGATAGYVDGTTGVQSNPYGR